MKRGRAAIARVRPPQSSRCCTSRRAGDSARPPSSAAEPVLAWTLDRLRRASGLVASTAVLCWEDQLPRRSQPIAEEQAGVRAGQGPAMPLADVEAVAAARRWADGWRGGLLRTCEFDRGLPRPLGRRDWPPKLAADAVVLVDPAAGWSIRRWSTRLIAHAEAHPRAPTLLLAGRAGAVRRACFAAALLEQLAAGEVAPRAVAALPAPTSRAASRSAARPARRCPTPLARTTHRFTLDSQRQIERIARATEPQRRN